MLKVKNNIVLKQITKQTKWQNVSLREKIEIVLEFDFFNREEE